jgi:large subunit ribosomal protein L6
MPAQIDMREVHWLLDIVQCIDYEIPEQIKVTVAENTKVMIEGPDKAMVGKVASELRAFYPPEPYKGKGVRYEGENVRRKEGKKVQ